MTLLIRNRLIAKLLNIIILMQRNRKSTKRSKSRFDSMSEDVKNLLTPVRDG